MPEEDKLDLPTQEGVERFYSDFMNQNKVESRIRYISEKLNVIYKEVFKIPEEMNLVFVGYIRPNKKLTFKVVAPTGINFFLPDIPLDCVWNETDLTINLNMMKSDLQEEYVKIRNKAREEAAAAEQQKETFWQWLKRNMWF